MSDEVNNADRREEEMQTDGNGEDGAGSPCVTGPTRVAPGLCAPIPDYHEDPKELHPSPEFSYRSGYAAGRPSYEYPPEGGCLPYDRHRLYGHRVLLNESRDEHANRIQREKRYRANNSVALKRIANIGSAAIERRSCCGPAPNVRSQPASESPASAASGGSPPRSDADAERHVAVVGTPAAAAAPGESEVIVSTPSARGAGCSSPNRVGPSRPQGSPTPPPPPESDDDDDAAVPLASYRSRLNNDQRRVYEEIMAAVREDDNANAGATAAHHPRGRNRCFFVDGPGGTGKTFLYRTIIHELEIEGVTHVATAWTGIAAALLPGGQTSHSAFKLPTQLSETSESSVNANSPIGDSLKNCRVIVWDEASMIHRYALECLDRLLKFLCSSDRPFGGKIVLLGGDFRQLPPVVPDASRATTVASSVKSSALWRLFQPLALTENLRLGRSDVCRRFASFLLEVGDGRANLATNASPAELFNFKIPDALDVAPPDFAVGDLVEWVYGSYFTRNAMNARGTAAAILCTTNEECRKINSIALDALPGEIRRYVAIDTVIAEYETAAATHCPQEYLESVQQSGLPPHDLRLKTGALVMLVRNVDNERGFSNGARLRVVAMSEFCVTCSVVSGHHAGEEMTLTRIDIEPSEHSLPVRFKRQQFPFVLGFAMTVNKSQGQTLRGRVGLYLGRPVFGHGQMYVALSRVTDPSNLKIVIAHPTFNLHHLSVTRNVVYDELLD